MKKQLLIQEEQPAMCLHKNIRYLRKQMNMSQEELARRIGLNRGNIASYENGTAEPRICNLLKFSRLFGISVYQLTHGDLSRAPHLPSANGSVGKGLDDTEREKLLLRFEEQAEKTRNLIRSIRTCCHSRKESREEVPEELRAFMVYFEQLFEVADHLLCEHQALIRLGQNNFEEPPEK